MKIRIKQLVISGGILGGSILTSCQDISQEPNIILIFADDLGYGDVSCLNPDSKIYTPNIDGLAASGVTFTDAHSSSAVSTPSRYGLLTGRYAWRTRLKKGVLQGFSAPLIEENRNTIASILNTKGYQTACIGKWHLGINWQTVDGKSPQPAGKNIDYTAKISNGPTSRGFDYFYGISASMDMPPYLFIENEKVEVPNIEYSKMSFKKTGLKNPYGRSGFAIESRKPQDFLPSFTKRVIGKIEKYSKASEPFFIYYPLTAPHTPIAPNDEFTGKSEVGSYGDFVLEVDNLIGQVVEELGKQGILENTVIILTSDNGPEKIAYERYMEYGHNSSGYLKGVKRDLWEGGHRVPLFISWPDVISPRTVEATVVLCDIYSTLADIVSYEIASTEAEDSYSLLPLLKDEEDYKRDGIIHHSASGRFAIRKGDWVLIERGVGNDNAKYSKDYYKSIKHELREGVNGELYNLKNDLAQYNNLYSKYPEVVLELTNSLNKIRENY